SRSEAWRTSVFPSLKFSIVCRWSEARTILIAVTIRSRRRPKTSASDMRTFRRRTLTCPGAQFETGLTTSEKHNIRISRSEPGGRLRIDSFAATNLVRTLGEYQCSKLGGELMFAFNMTLGKTCESARIQS